MSGVTILNDGDNHTVTVFADPHTSVWQKVRYWDCESGSVEFLPSLRLGMVVAVPGEQQKLTGVPLGAWVVCRPHQLVLHIRAGVRVVVGKVTGYELREYYRAHGPWPMVGVLQKRGTAGNAW